MYHHLPKYRELLDKVANARREAYAKAPRSSNDHLEAAMFLGMVFEVFFEVFGPPDFEPDPVPDPAVEAPIETNHALVQIEDRLGDEPANDFSDDVKHDVNDTAGLGAADTSTLGSEPEPKDFNDEFPDPTEPDAERGDDAPRAADHEREGDQSERFSDH